MEVEQVRAHHEAAHVVLALLAGFEVNAVTIEPDPTWRSGGHVDWNLPVTADERVRDAIMAWLAGYVAAQMATGEEDPRRWESRDYEEARGLAWAPGLGDSSSPGPGRP